MAKLIYYLLVFAFFAFISCNDRQTILDKDFGTKFLTDSFKLKNVSDYFNSIHCKNNNGNILIYYVSANKDKIYVMGEQKSLIDSIFLPNFLKDKNFDFYVDSDKIFYTLISELNIVCEFKDSNLIKVYRYHSSDSETQIMLASFFYDFEVISGTVVLDKIPNYKIFLADQRRKYFESQLVVAFYLRNDSLIEKKSSLKFPKDYVNHFYRELYPIVCRINKDSVVSIYSSSEELHIFNFSLNKEQEYTIVGLQPNKLSPYNTDSIQYLSYSKKYELENSKFLKILYDKISKNFAIIQLLKVTKYPSDDKYMPVYEDKPVLISIIDSTFKVKKKIYFDHQYNNMFAGSYYSNSRLYVPEFTKNKSNVIRVFEIK